jgi:N-acetylgalactosamine-N,N'-diacetylbacillosaminyl-diphospho-undecaprenol 4-alpha-N-acetylgalactosaminyltransferase
LNEGLPNVILESLACETPVIAFDCSSGPREMIQHKNGLLVANQDVEKLSEAIIRRRRKFISILPSKMRCKSVQSFRFSTIGATMVGFNEYQLKIEL